MQEAAFLRRGERSVDTLNLHNIVGGYYNSERLDSDANPRKRPKHKVRNKKATPHLRRSMIPQTSLVVA